MVRIDSTNPGLAGGPGEAAFAAYLTRQMQALGMEVDVWDVLPGRPNVVGRLPGSGAGRSLMLSATWTWWARGARTRSNPWSATGACTVAVPPT